ncbi:hypothetical protein ID866_4925 [Astraeus odoratus]|nr:hypothetical protein ID866_4925 [Astraeus odoratus]
MSYSGAGMGMHMAANMSMGPSSALDMDVHPPNTMGMGMNMSMGASNMSMNLANAAPNMVNLNNMASVNPAYFAMLQNVEHNSNAMNGMMSKFSSPYQSYPNQAQPQQGQQNMALPHSQMPNMACGNNSMSMGGMTGMNVNMGGMGNVQNMVNPGNMNVQGMPNLASGAMPQLNRMNSMNINSGMNPMHMAGGGPTNMNPNVHMNAQMNPSLGMVSSVSQPQQMSAGMSMNPQMGQMGVAAGMGMSVNRPPTRTGSAMGSPKQSPRLGLNVGGPPPMSGAGGVGMGGGMGPSMGGVTGVPGRGPMNAGVQGNMSAGMGAMGGGINGGMGSPMSAGMVMNMNAQGMPTVSNMSGMGGIGNMGPMNMNAGGPSGLGAGVGGMMGGASSGLMGPPVIPPAMQRPEREQMMQAQVRERSASVQRETVSILGYGRFSPLTMIVFCFLDIRASRRLHRVHLWVRVWITLAYQILGPWFPISHRACRVSLDSSPSHLCILISNRPFARCHPATYLQWHQSGNLTKRPYLQVQVRPPGHLFTVHLQDRNFHLTSLLSIQPLPRSLTSHTPFLNLPSRRRMLKRTRNRMTSPPSPKEMSLKIPSRLRSRLKIRFLYLPLRR